MGFGSNRTPIAFVFAAGAMVIASVSQQAEAATVSITGGSAVSVPLGTTNSDNNVVNFAPSGVTVPGGGTYYGLQCGNPCGNWVTGAQVNTSLSNFNVSWYFVGSESGNVNTLSSPSGTLIQTELNQNNNQGSSPPSILYAGVLTPISSFSGTSFSFKLADTTSGSQGTLTNLLVATGSSSAFMVAYVLPHIVGGKMVGWDTSSTATDWFAIGYNDPGSTDRDYDDLMAVGHISAVPLPGALPLFATGLGALGLFGWRRKRKQTAAIAA
jgi:hypothetical protein